MIPNYEDLVSSYIEEAMWDKDMTEPSAILDYVEECIYQYAIDNDERFDEENAPDQVKDKSHPIGSLIAQALEKVIDEAEEILGEVRFHKRFGGHD